MITPPDAGDVDTPALGTSGFDAGGAGRFAAGGGVSGFAADEGVNGFAADGGVNGFAAGRCSFTVLSLPAEAGETAAGFPP